MTITTVQALAKALQDQGIPVLSVSDWNEQVDGEIRITPTLDVQVGLDCAYATVNWTRGEGADIEFWSSPATHRPQDPTSFVDLVAEILNRIKEHP